MKVPGSKLSSGALAICVLGLATSTRAATTFYASSAAFVAAEPTASPVSFGSLGPVQPYIHANPLVLPGVTFSTVAPGSSASALIVFDDSIGDNWFGDTLVLTPDAATTAIGAEIFNEIGEPGATLQSAPITERVYSGATLLGSVTRTEVSGFFGVSSTTPITKVTFLSDCASDCSTFANTVSLVTPTSAAPEPSSWLLMLTGFGALGMAARRRRSAVELA